MLPARLAARELARVARACADGGRGGAGGGRWEVSRVEVGGGGVMCWHAFDWKGEGGGALSSLLPCLVGEGRARLGPAPWPLLPARLLLPWAAVLAPALAAGKDSTCGSATLSVAARMSESAKDE